MIQISIDEEPFLVPIFLKKIPTQATILLTEKDLDKSYGVNGIPATFIIDQKGIVRFNHTGFGPGGEKDLMDKIDKLLDEAGSSNTSGKTK